MQALQRSGVEKTQLKSLYMTYWKSNIIFTNSTRKPLQMARNWLNAMAKSICLIKSILPLPWQLKHKIKLFREALCSNLLWTLRNLGKKPLGWAHLCGKHHAAFPAHQQGYFHIRSQAPGRVGCVLCNRNYSFPHEAFPVSSTRSGSIKTNKSADSAEEMLQILQESSRTEMGS